MEPHFWPNVSVCRLFETKSFSKPMNDEHNWIKPDISHDDVIKWKHFSRYWPFVRVIHRSSVNSPLKGQWRRALMFQLICAWTNTLRANNREASYLRRHRAHCDVTVIPFPSNKSSDQHFTEHLKTYQPHKSNPLFSIQPWYLSMPRDPFR